MTNYQPVRLVNKSQIQKYLEKDRLYAAYAIGDLDPQHFSRCSWFGAQKHGKLDSMIMMYQGLEPPILFSMGTSEGIEVLLMAMNLPDIVYLTSQVPHLDIIKKRFSKISPIMMWRMYLRQEVFSMVQGNCERLTSADIPDINRLYGAYSGTGYDPGQVIRGVYYGIWMDGKLVSMAGTHLISETYQVAAVGNVVTHPDYVSRGFGTLTTSAVVAELLERKINDIVLNVAKTNIPAIRIYEKLGFRKHTSFIEGSAEELILI